MPMSFRECASQSELADARPNPDYQFPIPIRKERSIEGSNPNRQSGSGRPDSDGESRRSARRCALGWVVVVILSYDPIAGEVEVDHEDGRPRLGYPTRRLIVKQYREGGILFAEASGHTVEIGILPDFDPVASPILVPLGGLRWRVELSSGTTGLGPV